MGTRKHQVFHGLEVMCFSKTVESLPPSSLGNLLRLVTSFCLSTPKSLDFIAYRDLRPFSARLEKMTCTELVIDIHRWLDRICWNGYLGLAHGHLSLFLKFPIPELAVETPCFPPSLPLQAETCPRPVSS